MSIKFQQFSSALLLEVNQFIDETYPTLKPSHKSLANSKEIVTVYNEGKIAAFCGLYVNPLFPRELFVGNYESLETSASSELLTKVEEYAVKEGYEKLVGPMNGTTWESYRFRTSSNSPFFMEFIHKDYYVDQWKAFGFEEFANYQSNEEQLANVSISGEDIHSSFQIRNLEDAEADLKAICQLSNELFKSNLYFTPVHEETFVNQYKEILPYVDPDLVQLVYDKDELIAYFFAIKDHYHPTRVIAKTLARKPDIQYKGLGHIMAARFIKTASAKGFTSMINAYFHVENNSSAVSANFGGKCYQTYALYSKRI